MCDACLGTLPRAEPPRCRVCWLPQAGAFCPHCDLHPAAFDALRSVFRYEAEVRRLVHDFKFRNCSALAEALAAPMSEVARAPALTADLVVPVPLSTRNERERGYNQASLLARRIGGSLGLPVVAALMRVRPARPQSLTSDAFERRRNVEGAFAARRPDVLEDKAVLLVDDVATTGATLDACARALGAAGALYVGAITFAREDG